jgi:hypothetical protein
MPCVVESGVYELALNHDPEVDFRLAEAAFRIE